MDLTNIILKGESILALVVVFNDLILLFEHKKINEKFDFQKAKSSFNLFFYGTTFYFIF
jgi:hypothetical protein